MSKRGAKQKLEASLKRKEMKLKGKLERQKIREKSNAQARVNRSAAEGEAAINKSRNYAERVRQENQTKRSMARSTALAGTASALGNSMARTKEAEYEAAMAKYTALVTGNTSGTNAIDPAKDGDNGSGDVSTSNPKPRWPI